MQNTATIIKISEKQMRDLGCQNKKGTWDSWGDSSTSAREEA